MMRRNQLFAGLLVALCAILAGCDSELRKQFRAAAVPGLASAATQVASGIIDGSDPKSAIDAGSTTGWSAVIDGLAAMGDPSDTTRGANTGDSVTSGRNTR